MGGFHVTNYTVFDKALEELEKDVTRKTSKEAKDLVTIEFARGSYHDAFNKFSIGFIQDAYFFFIDTGVETCIQRISKRVTDPPTSDHHYVPDEIMRKYFDKDNWSYMADEFKKAYGINKEIVLYSNTGSIEELYAHVDRFAEAIFANEFTSMSQICAGYSKGLDLKLVQPSSTNPQLGGITPFTSYFNSLEAP